jgi:alkylhydroperoxidase family enzyme
MLRYAVKLTKDPGSIVESDIEDMRRLDFSDTDILHIAEVTGYYAYANRIASGLGIPLEDWIPED